MAGRRPHGPAHGPAHPGRRALDRPHSQHRPAAAAWYRRLAAIDPYNPMVDNNLAWLLAEMGCRGEALRYAGRALALAPSDPEVLDTWMHLRGEKMPVIRQRWFATVALLVAADQLAKWSAFSLLSPGQAIPVVGSLAVLSIRQNPAFINQWGAGLPGIRILTTVATLLALACLTWVYRSKLRHGYRSGWTTAFMALAMSGALGNLIDRLFLGYTRDFLRLSCCGTVNLADIYLSLSAGAITMALYVRSSGGRGKTVG